MTRRNAPRRWPQSEAVRRSVDDADWHLDDRHRADRACAGDGSNRLHDLFDWITLDSEDDKGRLAGDAGGEVRGHLASQDRRFRAPKADTYDIAGFERLHGDALLS